MNLFQTSRVLSIGLGAVSGSMTGLSSGAVGLVGGLFLGAAAGLACLVAFVLLPLFVFAVLLRTDVDRPRPGAAAVGAVGFLGAALSPFIAVLLAIRSVAWAQTFLS